MKPPQRDKTTKGVYMTMTRYELNGRLASSTKRFGRPGSKVLIGITALLLIITFASCKENQESNPFENTSWYFGTDATEDHNDGVLTFAADTWELNDANLGGEVTGTFKGTYTFSGNTAKMTVTHKYEYSEWNTYSAATPWAQVLNGDGTADFYSYYPPERKAVPDAMSGFQQAKGKKHRN